MYTQSKWEVIAERYNGKATYTDTANGKRKRTDRIKKKEANAITSAYNDLDGNSRLVADIFKRSRATISSILSKTEPKKLLKHYSKHFIKSNRMQQEADLLNQFIEEWGNQIPLPLDALYLDEEDLSKKKALIDLYGNVTKWSIGPDKQITRIFAIEERSEFKLVKKSMPHSKIWFPFNNCKQTGGSIIAKCSALTQEIEEDVKQIKEIEIVGTDNIGLDRYFLWSIHADALHLLTAELSGAEYKTDDKPPNLKVIHWAGNNLAIVNRSKAAKVINDHKKLRSKYKDSVMIKEIDEMRKELKQSEDLVLEELNKLQQSIMISKSY